MEVVGNAVAAGWQGCWLADKIPRSPEVMVVVGVCVCRVVAGRLDPWLAEGAVLLVLSAEVALPLAGLL